MMLNLSTTTLASDNGVATFGAAKAELVDDTTFKFTSAAGENIDATYTLNISVTSNGATITMIEE